jgi:hypothetical protein
LRLGNPQNIIILFSFSFFFFFFFSFLVRFLGMGIFGGMSEGVGGLTTRRSQEAAGGRVAYGLGEEGGVGDKDMSDGGSL